MEVNEKLQILTDSAKYDVACTSSGTNRASKSGFLGSAEACGICHSYSADGRCVSLLKVLQSNACIFDCSYCVNRVSNDIKRATFTPKELADLTINFYKRNYIEGLFLSSAVVKSPDYTMELLYNTLFIIRNEYYFNGYIHVKAIPGADDSLIYKTGLIADRMSCNIELPSEKSLQLLAPDKTKTSVLLPMKTVRDDIKKSKEELILYKNAPKFVPSGQSTQMIIGATNDSDKQIINLAQGLYDKMEIKRVFYSAFIPVGSKEHFLPTSKPPLLREHRLYQADWLLRFYNFTADEILNADQENLDLNMDPKCRWAINNLHLFPVEINKASKEALLRVPGIGTISINKILKARRTHKLDFYNLKKMGIVLKRAKYFITCDGKMFSSLAVNEKTLEIKLSENKINEFCSQISLFDNNDNAQNKNALQTQKKLNERLETSEIETNKIKQITLKNGGERICSNQKLLLPSSTEALPGFSH